MGAEQVFAKAAFLLRKKALTATREKETRKKQTKPNNKTVQTKK